MLLPPPLALASAPANADAWIIGQGSNTRLGYDVNVGDINGDSIDDLLMGARGLDDGDGNDQRGARAAGLV